MMGTDRQMDRRTDAGHWNHVHEQEVKLLLSSLGICDLYTVPTHPDLWRREPRESVLFAILLWRDVVSARQPSGAPFTKMD